MTKISEIKDFNSYFSLKMLNNISKYLLCSYALNENER